MRKTFLFWLLAFIITAAGAYYQRITGPTYPASGKFFLSGKEINYKLERSHISPENCLVEIKADPSVKGFLEWKRYKTNDKLISIPMTYSNGTLSAELPKQPPAGKLFYQVVLKSANDEITIPPVVIRFKGDVPLFILIPHVLAMFAAMLLSTRAGLEFFNKQPNFKKHTYWTVGILFIGGLILGPIVQLYAFGAFWTGVPFGFDLTDNKTLIAFIGWIAALIAIYKSKKPKIWVLGAAILLLVVYLIPHSVLGSELDYNKTDQLKDKSVSHNMNENQTSFDLLKKSSGKNL